MDLARVTPGMAGRFLDSLSGGPAAKQQALSGCRQYCAGLVQRHAMILNPFASVTGARYQVIEGRTPEITISQARALLASLETSRLLGRRDRALFGTLCYTGERIGATLALQRGDLVDATLRLREKGGKQRILPVSGDRHGWLLAWVEAAGIAASDAPLFQCSGSKVLKFRIISSDKSADLGASSRCCCRTAPASGIVNHSNASPSKSR